MGRANTTLCARVSRGKLPDAQPGATAEFSTTSSVFWRWPRRKMIRNDPANVQTIENTADLTASRPRLPGRGLDAAE